MNNDSMWIIGHRGAAGMWPENTLLAIDNALTVGADWVEIDIRLVDGELIVLHDQWFRLCLSAHDQ